MSRSPDQQWEMQANRQADRNTHSEDLWQALNKQSLLLLQYSVTTILPPDVITVTHLFMPSLVKHHLMLLYCYLVSPITSVCSSTSCLCKYSDLTVPALYVTISMLSPIRGVCSFVCVSALSTVLPYKVCVGLFVCVFFSHCYSVAQCVLCSDPFEVCVCVLSLQRKGSLSVVSDRLSSSNTRSTSLYSISNM